MIDLQQISKKHVQQSAFIYMAILILVIVIGALLFSGQYSRPPVEELPNTSYKLFLLIAAWMLIPLLAIWGTMVGFWKKSLPWAIGSLAFGGFITALGFAVLPWIYYPNDQYPGEFFWVMNASIPVLVIWAILTYFGHRKQKLVA